MEVVNEARLMELAREPVRELLPAARRATVVQPLIVLLAFLPALLVFWNPSLDETTCQQGLRALDVIANKRPMDWIVTASRQPSENSPMIPLANLLTALGLQVDLLAPESRLLLTSYLSSALLLLSVASLAKKLGGSRLALLTVLLACGHREFLALSGTLPPVALALAFAVLSFRGLISHQMAGARLVSWSLMGSSLALAACWLAGGELAIGAWCVLCVQALFGACTREGVPARASWGRRIRQWLLNLVSVLLSLLLMTAIAVAVVAGWEFAGSGRIRLFEMRWPLSWAQILWPVESRSASAAQALLEFSGAWLGLALLGVMSLVRGRMRTRDDGGEHGPWFLIGWCGVAWLSWWMTWPGHRGEFTDSLTWPGFLLLPLLLVAAWGLEAVLQREFSLGSVVIALLATVAAFAAPSWTARILSSVSVPWLVVSALLASALIFGGVRLCRQVAQSEPRCRRVLLSCVAFIIIADMAAGVRSRPKLADDERELRAFRRQLAEGTQPHECWLLAEEPASARLRFFVRSLWRSVELREARDWESIFSEPSRTSQARPSGIPDPSNKARAIVVTWGSVKLPAEDIRRRGLGLIQATTPHYFQRRPLKAYRWSVRSELSSTR